MMQNKKKQKLFALLKKNLLIESTIKRLFTLF